MVAGFYSKSIEHVRGNLMTEIRQTIPWTAIDALEKCRVLAEERSLRVIEPQTLPVLRGPFFLIADFYLVDWKMPELCRRFYRNGEPAPTFLCSDFIAIG